MYVAISCAAFLEHGSGAGLGVGEGETVDGACDPVENVESTGVGWLGGEDKLGCPNGNHFDWRISVVMKEPVVAGLI